MAGGKKLPALSRVSNMESIGSYMLIFKKLKIEVAAHSEAPP